MQILAKEQQKLFEEGISEEEFQKRHEEFLKLYFELRTKEEDKIWNQLTLEQRKKSYKAVLGLYKLYNRAMGFSYELIKDESNYSPKTTRPIIFVPTHIGKFDIQMICEILKTHFYLLSGDYEHIQGTINAPLLSVFGVLYFYEKLQAERKNIVNKMISHLLQGGNLMWFIEGTWNVTPNLPVLPCYWSIVDVAKETNAIIIPIAIEQYGKRFKINVGKNFEMGVYGNGNLEKTRAITDLRDTLATLKWEIWETESKNIRSSLLGNEWEEYKQQRYKEWPGFNDEYINQLIYRPKDKYTGEKIATPDEVFNLNVARKSLLKLPK